MDELNSSTIELILEETLEYSRERGYIGWDKHDGMSSQIRMALPFETTWTNLAFQEMVKRSPINLRRVLLVEQRPSPKGFSLFSMANLQAFHLTGKDEYRSEARELLDCIVSYNLDDYNGFCLSHNHDLQRLSSKSEVGTPGIVSTSFGVKALLRAGELDQCYENIARTAVDYVNSELQPIREGDQIRINYKPTDAGDTYTLNANALGARLFLDLHNRFTVDEYRKMAEGILTYVANHQEPNGGWHYSDPPSASHLGMDNYHNGFILESFLRYQEVVDEDAYADVVDRALDFYRHDLYDDDGAPHWDESSRYPRDIHAAAQGIIVFTHAGDLAFARRIIDWTLEHLYAGDGRFYYQQRKYYTKKFTLMRWCQAWMAYALSEYLLACNRT